MTTLDEYAPKATYRFCLYGPPKAGKTALAVQLAQLFKLHWFDLEDGIKTALKPGILEQKHWKNINLFPIHSTQQAPMAVETLMKVVKGAECLICWTHGKVSCPVCSKAAGATINRICLNEFTVDDMLVIDSTTKLSVDANFATNPVLRAADSPEALVLDKDTGGKDFKYPMAVSFILDRIFGTLESKRINLCVISHEVMTETLKDTGHAAGKGENQPTMGGEKIFPSCGSRNFSRAFGKYFDTLIHCELVNMKHKAFSLSTHDSTSLTGSRLPDIESMVDKDGKVLPPFEGIVKLVEIARAHGTKNKS